jgi:HEAT repeat protein
MHSLSSPLASRPPASSLRDAAIFAELLGRFSRKLKGDARARIATFFELAGDVGRELDRLTDRRAWRRAQAAYLLGDMDSSTAVPGLLGALDDPRRDVRAAAARSLGRLGAASAVEPLVESLVGRRVPWAAAGQALLEIGAQAVPQLRALVLHPEAEVRARATELIGLVGAAGEADLLIGRLHDASAEVRANAARSLGRLGAEEAEAEVRAALDDRISFVRSAAAFALGQIGDQGSVEALLRVARVDTFESARAAARALARIAPAELAEAARDPNAGAHLCEATDLAAL